MSNTWKGTKELYYEYVNTAPKIDLNSTLEMPPGVMKLAPLMVGMDRHLESLLQVLVSQDSLPPQDVLERLVTNYPWLGGIAVIDPYGQVMAGTYAPVKEIDYMALVATPENEDSAPLENESEKLKVARALHAQVQDNPLGPEICLAYPFFEASELRGYTIVHFDMRSLVGLSAHPEELIVFTSESLLWPGDNEEQAQALWQKPWAEILKDDVYGEISSGGQEYFWMARYIGELRLVYATAIDPDFKAVTDVTSVMSPAQPSGVGPEDEVKTRALSTPMPTDTGSFGPKAIVAPMPGQKITDEHNQTIIIDDAQPRTGPSQRLHEEDITARERQEKSLTDPAAGVSGDSTQSNSKDTQDASAGKNEQSLPATAPDNNKTE